MNFLNDPNLLRRDIWFADPADVVAFLNDLLREHAGVAPQLVSKALLQARKNLVIGPPRQDLRVEVSRLLVLAQMASLAKAA